MPDTVAPYTAALISKNLNALTYGDTVVRLMQFAHDNPGLQALRVQIGHAIANLIAKDPAAIAELAKVAGQ